MNVKTLLSPPKGMGSRRQPPNSNPVQIKDLVLICFTTLSNLKPSPPAGSHGTLGASYQLYMRLNDSPVTALWAGSQRGQGGQAGAGLLCEWPI